MMAAFGRVNGVPPAFYFQIALLYLPFIAVDLIVSIAKAPNKPGRLVQEVVSVSGIVDGAYQLSNAE